MAETKNPTVAGEQVQTMSGAKEPIPGSAGLQTQVPGGATTVSQAAASTGGIDAGNFVTTDIDEQLFRFNSDDTPLMQLMLKAKKVNVTSPEVEHFMIDEPRSSVFTNNVLTANNATQAVLPLDAADQEIPAVYGTLLVRGVDGYMPDGKTKTPGKDLLLYVTGRDATTNNPIVRALNGTKKNVADEICQMVDIPAGTEISILSNALYETQKEVEPDLILPQPTLVYLQKRGMNQIVSDYFDAQAKRIPFTKALIAEQAIANFKVRGNRTLWASRPSKFKVNVPKMGMQYVYTTEGVRWQFKRELQHTGKWTFEEFVALMKMFFTGEDVPKSALALCGKNILENIQCIDFSKHPEVTISVTTNALGWSITNIHTVFGDLQLKREPTLDRLGWSNCMAILGEDRLVHYQYAIEHSFTEQVDGEEATRTGVLVWDALALKGSCHIWVDGNGGGGNTSAANIVMWNKATAPTGKDLVEGRVYYLLTDCPDIDAKANQGELWQYKNSAWAEYKGTLSV